ncbi:NUDIX domain-containing protein [Actinomadura nitritigenes]|uniref:NUDIX domain-containing protein n=1 Tax=Actinomadura nitritigenes TaxID=134602 RepID=UPI0036A5801F
MRFGVARVMTSFGAGPSRASALIFNGRGEYLLHLRDDIPGIVEPGAWSLLGGGREPGDRSLAETIRRELREEAGLELPVLEPFAVDEVVERGSARTSCRGSGSPRRS